MTPLWASAYHLKKCGPENVISKVPLSPAVLSQNPVSEGLTGNLKGLNPEVVVCPFWFIHADWSEILSTLNFFVSEQLFFPLAVSKPQGRRLVQ